MENKTLSYQKDEKDSDLKRKILFSIYRNVLYNYNVRKIFLTEML